MSKGRREESSRAASLAAGFSIEDVERSADYHGRLRGATRKAVLGAQAAMIAMSLGADALDLPRRVDTWPWVPTLVGIVLVANLIAGAPLIALAGWRSLRLDRSFGVGRDSAGDFMRRIGRDNVVPIAVAEVTAVLLWCCLRWTSAWWPWAWLVLAASAVVESALWPVRISLAHPFQAAPADLAEPAHRLAGAAGADLPAIVMAPVRARWSGPNAAVGGLGPLSRVILFDTLADLPPDQRDAILAHEIGHVVNRDVAKRAAVRAVLSIFAVFAVAVVGSGSPFGEFDPSWRASPGAYPALVFPLFAANMLSMIVLTLVARRQEAAADKFALDLTGDAEAFRAMIRAVSTGNLAPLQSSGVGGTCTHPPSAERIAAANAWERARE